MRLLEEKSRNHEAGYRKITHLDIQNQEMLLRVEVSLKINTF